MINSQKLNEIAKTVNKEIPKDTGFALVIFDTVGDLKEFRYISNCQRSSMIDAFEGLLVRWKNERITDN